MGPVAEEGGCQQSDSSGLPPAVARPLPRQRHYRAGARCSRPYRPPTSHARPGLLRTAAATAALGLLSVTLAPASHAASPARDACQSTGNSAPKGDCGPFKQAFRWTFTGDTVPLGSFSDCNHHPDTRDAYCGGLTGKYRTNWWAYPAGWPDTAKSGADGNTGREVGGIYHPEDTVSVSPNASGDGQMHIHMWRPSSGGDIRSAAVVPRPLMEQRYGKYTERFRVSKAAPGYKSAHLWYGHGCEIDYPEQNWADTIHAFTHPCDGGPQDAFDTGAAWTSWHTTSVEWTPGNVRYFLDGLLIGASTAGIPARPLSWVLQNESALYGPYAAPGSSAQLDITWVTGYTYEPQRRGRRRRGHAR